MKFYHGTRLKNLKVIKSKGLLPLKITKKFKSYPTDENKVFVTSDLEEAKFYTKIHSDKLIFEIDLNNNEYKKFGGKQIGDTQHTFNYIPKNKLKIILKEQK